MQDFDAGRTLVEIVRRMSTKPMEVELGGKLEKPAFVGKNEPRAIQLNGAFYVIGNGVFGRLSPGINDSDLNLMNGYSKELNSDEGMQSPLVPGVDDELTFNLKRGDEIRKMLNGINLPFDLIPIINLRSKYRSHKHGYACDGCDTILHSAGKAEFREYHDALNKKDLELFNTIRETPMKSNEMHRILSSSEISFLTRRPAYIHDMLIVTPRIILSFPRNVTLTEKYDSPLIWDEETDFCLSPKFYAEYSKESKEPFGVYLFENANAIRLGRDNISAILTNRMEQSRQDWLVLERAVTLSNDYVNRLNFAYNAL